MSVKIVIPTVGESISEVTIAAWLKQDGESVELDEPIVEIESDKASMELTAESAGKLSIQKQEGETVKIGETIGQLDVDNHSPKKADSNSKESPPKVPKETPDASSVEGHPSPAARKILSEKGIDSSEIEGSGPGGRVTKSDALKVDKPQEKQSEAQTQTQNASSERSTEKKRMSGLRKTIAKRLVEVKNQTAMLTTFNEVDMTAVMELRKKYKEAFKSKHGVGLGFMSFFTKAVCHALKEFPAVNGKIENESIIYHHYCDIGVAVSTERGLVVPVVRNAEKLAMNDIEAKIIELASKARDNKISLEEMQGGTFTITNGGVFGSMLSTPIINAPQSAILGMHNIVERPVAVDGKVEIRPIMYLALSYDHRIVDGRESVSFLKMVKEFLESPSRMLLGV